MPKAMDFFFLSPISPPFFPIPLAPAPSGMLYYPQRAYAASDRPQGERKDGTMRRVKCEDCGKVYDFDTDDFCPRCGAFAFPKGDRIGADGSVVRVEGISESNHKGSFLHEEYHAENRHRKATGLDRGADRSRGLHWAPTPSAGKRAGVSSPVSSASRPTAQSRNSAAPEAEIRKVIGWLVGIIILGSFFLEFLDIMRNLG
mgnify:FL=1